MVVVAWWNARVKSVVAHVARQAQRVIWSGQCSAASNTARLAAARLQPGGQGLPQHDFLDALVHQLCHVGGSISPAARRSTISPMASRPGAGGVTRLLETVERQVLI
jgi:hypothetical protein